MSEQADRTSLDEVGPVRPSSASTPRIDVPQLKNFTAWPGPLYFLSYANTADLLLYLLGFILALLSALPFSGIDILYGRWASGLVNPNPDGSPPSAAAIRAISDQSAYIGVGITFGMWATTGGFFYCMSLASSRVVARMRRAYLAAILAQDATYFESIGPGEVASRLQRDLELVKVGCGEKLGFILWSFSGLICGVTISFWAAPRVGGVLFSILPFAAIIFVSSGFVSSRASSRMSKSEGEAASFLEQLLSSIRIVKVFQASKPLVGVYDNHLGKIQKDGKFIAVSKGITYSGSYSAIFACYALAFWYGGKQVAWHGLDTGKLITSFFSMFSASFAIVNILPHITAFIDALEAQARIRTEIERSSRIDHRRSEGTSAFVAQVEKALDQGQNGLDIELRNVSFAFPSRPNHKSLDHVSLHIPAGRVVALVGASGSGKSTITALLLRQYDLLNPDSENNNVFVNSQPVSSIQVSFLRSQIAMVAQDPQLVSASILENVAVGLTGTPNELKADRSNINEVEVLCKSALESAQAWAFVQRLPQGVHTNVSGGKTGVLSGGQRQRIAIARALIRRPKILIMDEATSALDSHTEGQVQKAIAAEQKACGMTVILIAHRLSTVRDADKIVVMGAGRKLEEGSHDELVALNGAYASMLNRHHGVVPGDHSHFKEEEEDMEMSVQSVTDYTPPTHHQAVHPTLPTPHHMPAPTFRNTSEMFRPTSRPGARGNYSFGMQQAEEAQASVDKAQADSQTTTRGQWDRFLGYVREQRRWIFPGVLCSVLIGAAFPARGYLTGAVVHALSTGPPSQVASATARFALYFLVIAISIAILCFSEGWFLENGAQRLTRRMRKTATEAILRQEVGWFDDEKNASGGLSASIASHPSQVAVATGLVSGRLVVAFVNLFGSLILALVLSWDVALVGFSPLLILIPVGVMEVICFGRYETESEQPTVAAVSYATESIDAVKTVAAYGREGQVVEQFDRLQQPNVEAHRNSLALGSVFFGLGQASFPLLVVLVFWYGGDKYAKGQISVTNLFAVFESSFIGAYGVGKAFGFIGDMSRSFHSFRAFSRWIERLPRVAKLDSAITHSAPIASEKAGGADIIFSKVRLVYPTRPERPAIHELDLHIRSGEKVAFCGPSGGGKSSVLALLARFYESSRGVITVDGEDIRSAELADHYERISLVSQDAVLYEGTVAFNLTLGLNRKVSEKELRNACADACILDFVESLPGGFEAQIGLKGGSMSGGQRQRICIARALLRNAKILLLDEATSALDNESESLVQRAIDRVSVGRTTLTVAHRLSTIRNADRIYVLEDGRIKEYGTHDELVRKGGRYLELIEAQL